MIQYKPGESWNTQFMTSSSTGAAANADSTPTVKVYRNGTDDTSNWSLAAVSNPATGRYAVSGTVYASASAGDVIEVEVQATIGGVAAKALVERFRLVQWPVTALPNAASGASGGVITSGTGTAQLTTSSGQVTVATNNDKTGYSLTQSFPTNFASLAITAGGAVTVGTNNDKTGYSLTQSFPTNFAALSIDASGRVDLGKWIGVAPLALSSQQVQAVIPSSSTIATVTGSVGSVTGNVGGNVTGSVGSLATQAKTDVEGAVWDGLTINHVTAGSYGLLVATDLDATISSRMATFTLPANFSSLSINGSGYVTVVSNLDKTGYSLTQAFPANFAALSITAGGAVTVGTNNDKTGYSLTQSFPANFAALSIDGSGRVDLGKWIGTAPLALSSQQVQAVIPISATIAAVSGAVGSVTGDVAGKVLGGGSSAFVAPGVVPKSPIEKNTALPAFEFVMFDGDMNPVTGLTVTATRSIDGGAFASCTNSVTEVGSGAYKIDLDASDLNGTCVLFRMSGGPAVRDTLFTVVTQGLS